MDDDLLLLAMSPNLSEEPPLVAATEEEEGSGVSSKGLMPPKPLFPTGVSSSDEIVGVWNEGSRMFILMVALLYCVSFILSFEGALLNKVGATVNKSHVTQEIK